MVRPSQLLAMVTSLRGALSAKATACSASAETCRSVVSPPTVTLYRPAGRPAKRTVDDERQRRQVVGEDDRRFGGEVVPVERHVQAAGAPL